MRRSVKDIVVLLPGITGSVLERDGHDVFGLSAAAGLRAVLSRGQSLQDLALVDDPVDVDDLGDGVCATRLAPDATLIPGLWKIDGYGRVAQELRRTFELVPGENYFEFPYDWRRDNRVAARRLERESAEWLRRRRQQVPDAKLVLIGHSMGGLVSRYFLEVLGGWCDTRALVTFGTPYRGSLKALNMIVNGFEKIFGLVDLAEVVRSCTAVYQLLPIYPCLATSDDAPLCRLAQATGVRHLDHDRVCDAEGFHREIERAVEAHGTDDDYLGNGYRIHPIVGVEQPTHQSASLLGKGVKMLDTWNGEQLDGDGTVPTVSAVPIELSDLKRELPAATRHASLQNADHVLRYLRIVLTDSRQYRFKAGAPVTVSLDLDDLYVAGEPFVVRTRLSDPSRPAVAVVTRVADAAEFARVPVPASDADWRDVRLPPLEPGVWRVAVGGDDEVQTASDLFAVSSAVE